jgi:hypothetical protein
MTGFASGFDLCFDHGVSHDGGAGVSPDGWLPDRVTVGALTQAFPPDLVDRVIDAADARQERNRLLPTRLMVYFVLALWLFRGRNCGYGEVLSKLVNAVYHRGRAQDLLATGMVDPAGWVDAGGGRRWRPPHISNLSRARRKLGQDVIRLLFEQVAGPVGAREAAGVWVCGLRVVSIDGSSSDLPDSKDNRRVFGGPGNAKRDGAFPQVRWMAAAESGTGALIEATFGPYTVGEQTLALDLLPAFTPEMLVLADRQFLSYTLVRDTLATGAHILWRASASFTLRPVKVLSEGTYLAQLHPARKSDGPPISVRVIEYTVHTTVLDDEGQETTRSELFALVTDLLDVEEYPALDLARTYPMRWECETVIGHHKTDMGAGMPVLRSEHPEGVAQEMWALFAVYQALAQLIGTGVDATGVPPEKISFPHALAAQGSGVVADCPACVGSGGVLCGRNS